MGDDAQSPVPLIVGAGPTGLMLSLWLHKFSITHRIIDAAPRSGMTTRAIVMHARTLEFYRQLGLDEILVSKGSKIKRFAFHYNSNVRGLVPVTDSGQGLSKFPFILSITQDEQEEILERAVVERGGKVERLVELVGVKETGADVVIATLRTKGVEQEFAASYVIGCDGAHSAVRRSLGIDMEGGTYDRAFFVADTFISGAPTTPQQMNMCLSYEDFLMVIPLPHEQGRARLIGFIPREVEAANPKTVTFEDVESTVRRNASNLKVEKVNWFSRYKVHHRTAARFQQGRVFLCGDAAHIHSPVGGQGMNTGLGDASNLAWKLAAVHDGAPHSLLDTYTPERVPFAKKLVQTTDFAFTKMTGDSLVSRFLRCIVLPFLMPFVLRFFPIGPTIYKKTSQLEIEYRDSPMSAHVGVASKRSHAHAGDRLPWIQDVDREGVDNFEPLNSAGWQAHVYGEAPNWAITSLHRHGIPTHVFNWTVAVGKAGLQRDTLYIVRPDGYIGLSVGAGHPTLVQKNLDAYLSRWITRRFTGVVTEE
ncbi:hypothetical protein MMC25_008019 [Agyrium rufum]|nr:hypothetical protein [Agyrium rufum]